MDANNPSDPNSQKLNSQREEGKSEVRTPHPYFRLLRGYAFDPEFSIRLETAEMNEVVFEVPWEEKLEPGPCGEYVEVIDYDPSSECFYAPVDLDDKYLLAKDGLPPSEGNPRFHQQMVYAVAMRTIYNFERALGRKAMWAPRLEMDSCEVKSDLTEKIIDREFVQKLRIYPHALRENNAYYHPDKRALLMGYFPATESDPGRQYPGGTVFTCLSHDIIAHETTHALLDGLHQSFKVPSNEDQLAFHEAFADIVALFQHFSLPNVLRHQIGKTRGDLRSRNMLGELAQQFGQASGKRGALRSYIGRIDKDTGKWQPLEADPLAYQRELEPHARGALLVAAIFDAFLSIYERRTEDLLRIATSGTGILPSGAIHPDLVGRLSHEAAKAAQHVLTMCFRALDYCPPVDLTFGDYLRALITADYDLVPEDKFGYRVAFVEAFRRRGIYPLELRSLSVDALRWREASLDNFQDLLGPVICQLLEFADDLQYTENRRNIYSLTRSWCHQFKQKMQIYFRTSSEPIREKIKWAMGLDLHPDHDDFNIQSLTVAAKEGINKVAHPQIIFSLTQKLTRQPESENLPFDFFGGCTVIVDRLTAKVQFIVTKNVLSTWRLERQKAFASRQSMSLSDVYFSHSPLGGIGERFAMIHSDGEVY